MTMLDKYSREELIENFEKQIEYTVKVDRVLQEIIKYCEKGLEEYCTVDGFIEKTFRELLDIARG